MGTENPNSDAYIERIKKEKAEEAARKKKAAAEKEKQDAKNRPKPSPSPGTKAVPPVVKKSNYRTSKPDNSTIANQKNDAALAVGKADVAARAYEENPNKNNLAKYNRLKSDAKTKIKNILRYSDGTLYDVFVNTGQGQFLTPQQINFIEDQGWAKEYKDKVLGIRPLKKGEYVKDYVTGESVKTNADGSKTSTVPTGETYEYDSSGNPIKPSNKGLTPDEVARRDSTTKTPTLPIDKKIATGLDGVYVTQDSNGNDVYYWENNDNNTAYVALLGGKNGAYIAESKLVGKGYVSGSPISLESAVIDLKERYMDNEGGLNRLKLLLQKKGAYGSDAIAAKSLADSGTDRYFLAAVSNAISGATRANYSKIKLTKSSSDLMSIDDFLNSPGKMMNTSSIGNGNDGTVVTHQSFTPDQYEIAIDQLFQQTVGRGASEQELDKFLSVLRTKEAANPYTVTTTGSDTNTATKDISGGIDQGTEIKLMRDQALASPEAESYNKNVKYFDYFQEALAPAVQLG